MHTGKNIERDNFIDVIEKLHRFTSLEENNPAEEETSESGSVGMPDSEGQGVNA